MSAPASILWAIALSYATLTAILLGNCLLQALEHLFVGLVAGAQRDDDHLLAGEAVGDLRDQVESLLRGEARDDSDDREFRIGVLDAESGKQILLVFGLAGEILRRILRDRELVGLRAPLVVVDAVENAGHGGGAVAQHAFETESVFGGLDLLAVFLADRGDVVRIRQRAFQEIHLAEEFHLRHSEEIPREA